MVILGDCLEKLKEIADNSVDACVTDPPYGLKFMGKKWDYDVPSVNIWKEVLRVLKPGGHLLSFGGTRTYHRMAVAIEDAGFEIRDQIQWLYGGGFPKSHNIKEGDFKGFGTALKPANEPICLARKPLEKGLTIAENVLKWGCGAINIDGCRIETQDNLNGGTYGGSERESEIQRTMDGGKLKRGIGAFVQPQGRWPANIILDETAAEMLDGQSGFSPSNKRKTKANGLSSLFGYGGASRFFYVAKASKRERGTGNGHPTVKPIKLMEYLCKLITPPNGIVLDPFMGSGSTGIAAKRLGFEFIGIEMNKEYLEIAEKRIGA